MDGEDKNYQKQQTIKKFIDIKEASKICSMHPHTLRKYADEGKIKCYKTPGGKRKVLRFYRINKQEAIYIPLFLEVGVLGFLGSRVFFKSFS